MIRNKNQLERKSLHALKEKRQKLLAKCKEISFTNKDYK